MNSFALPGGHVFIGAGMMALMRNEDELAAVLGHEVEHIDLRHCAERVQFEAQMRKLNLQMAGETLALPISIFKAGYNKELELEADREGTQLAVFAGYSSQGAIVMFEAMDRKYKRVTQAAANSPQEEAARIALATLQGYFESHPPAQERIEEIKQAATVRNWPDCEMHPLQPEIAAIFRRQSLPLARDDEAPPRILR